MKTPNSILPLALVLLCLFVVLPRSVAAQEPNDIKTGSVLFFNHYTSDPYDPNREDTQLNITNTNAYSGISVHLFAVDGDTCSVADSFMYLTQSQTAQFFASDFDPGTKGYLVAVAWSGGPANFNFLTGTAYIRRADGKMADLPAVAVARRGGSIINNGNGTLSLVFDGVTYDRLPRTVALSTFNSQTTDSTCLLLYSPQNLFIGEAPSLSVFGLMFNELERSGSFSLTIDCYTEIPLGSIRVPYTVNGFIPNGQTGWLKVYTSRPLLGASLSKGPRFTGGRNLTTLTLHPTWSIIVPG